MLLGTDSILLRQMEETTHSYHEVKPSDQLAGLDHNHSHFVLVQDEDGSTFGAESALRGEFEKCLGAAVAKHATSNEEKTKKTTDSEKTDMRSLKPTKKMTDNENKKTHMRSLKHTQSVLRGQPEEHKEEQRPVPVVSICGTEPCNYRSLNHARAHQTQASVLSTLQDKYPAFSSSQRLLYSMLSSNQSTSHVISPS